MRAKDPAGARLLVVPNGHALVETYHPCCKEVVCHVLIPDLDHLPDLPELVTIQWRRDICEDKALCDGIKPPLCHDQLEVVRAGGILLRFWYGVIVPILVSCPPLQH